MEYPRVNMNGTSKDALMTAHLEAIEALSAAIDALYPLSPHGRDYPVPASSLANASQEHTTRVGMLCAVRNDLQTIAECIDGQGEK